MECLTVPEYAPPTVVEIGVFSSLTLSSFEGGLHFAQVSVGSLGPETPSPQPVAPGSTGDVLPGGTTSPADTDTGSGGTGDAGSVLGETATGAIPAAGGGNGSAPGGGGSGGSSVVGATAGSGDSLPFTGFAVGALGALGAVTTSAGVVLRRLTRRS